jgi:hypothetical protein
MVRLQVWRALLGRKRRRLLSQLAEALGGFGDVLVALVLVGHYLAATGRTHIEAALISPG